VPTRAVEDHADNAGHLARLKERFLRGDLNAYSDEALLELLLVYAIPQRDVRTVAEQLIAECGGLSSVLSADPTVLARVRGLGPNAVVLLKLVDWIRTYRQAEHEPEPSRHNVIEEGLQPSLFEALLVSPTPSKGAAKPDGPKPRRHVTAQISIALPADFAPVLTPIEVPRDALQFGFSNGPTSPHSSRTMMLAELRALLAACPPSASQDDYRTAVVEDNVLLKPTETTRHQTFVRLRELYALDRRVVLFRALRDLWDEDASAQPLIALLSAAAHDVILRSTAETILANPMGAPVTWQMLELAISQHFPDRYNHTTLVAMAQHTLSSWRQSGHLGGEAKKVRTTATCRPTAATYALLLGYLCSARGGGLFGTLWARLLDAPTHVVHEQARAASQRGWLEYRQAGNVTEITFRHLLREERQAIISE
jgi:hypothetical protein